MAVPSRKGRYDGELISPYKWVASTQSWTNIYNGTTSGGRDIGFLDLGLGDMSDIKTDSNGNLIIDFPDDFKIDFDFDFGAKHYPITLNWNSSPAVNMKVAHNGDTKTNWNSVDFVGGKTFNAKAGGYGQSENSFTVTTTEIAGIMGFGLYQVKITDSSGGSSIITGAHTGTFKFKKEAVVVIDPPTDYTLEIISDFSSGYVANVSGTSINNSRMTLIKLNGPFNVTSTTKPAGTKTAFRLVDSSNKELGKTDSGVFTGPTLAFGQKYTLYLTASKTTIPIVVIPPTPPTPPSGPGFNMVPYMVTETSTSGEAAPAYTLPILTIFPENQYVTLFTGVESTSSITVPFTTRNADWVNKRTKSVFKRSESTNSITLSSQDFPQGPGQYKVWLQPDSNINGTGEAKWIYVTVENKEYVPGPDITTINYPETIVGADYQGFNVDFEISWNSINTNYVDVFIGKVSDSTKLISDGDPQGVQKFNIAKILRKAGEALEESQDWVWFDLYLCPYNIEGDERTKGKTESVKIAFDKGNIILKRPSVIRDISDAICHQFNSDALGQDNSKYLTHLMHFGNGENKVIATWCTDYEEFSKYEDVIEEVANDEGEYVEQIITKKTHEEKTLVFKMYEPLPRSVQPNEQIWVSKIQSIPIIEQITLINEELHDCIELKPNFGEGICDPIGYQLYDDLVSSGSVSSTKLLSEFVSGSGFDLSDLNIEFTSAEREVVDSVYVDGVSTWGWGNFVKYSSATERVNNFLYKIKLVEFHDDRVVNLQSGSFYTGSVRIKKEIDDNIESAQKIKDNFDAFEKFLFTSSSADGLTYPGAGGSSISASTSTKAVDWYSDIILSAQYHDKYSTEYLVNNLPQHVRDNAEGEEFEMFFNMMGHHFDVIWLYTKSLAESKNLEHKYNNGIQDGLLSQMLKSLGWDAKMGVSAQALWQYAFGTTEDGTVVNSMSGKDRQEEVWRRLLNNLPYLMKHKGTSRAVKAALACYGVPSSMLTIMEFGGPRNGDGGASQVTFEDRTAAINISGSQSILVPWKQYDDTSDYPNTVEFRVNSDIRQDQTFVTSSLWSVGVVHYFGNQAKLKLTVADTTSSYFVTSSEFPFYNDEYTNIVVEKSGSVFTVKGKEAFQGRIRSDVSASLNVENNIWQTDTILKIGDGSTFTGSVDEFRYWTVPLSESRVDNHTLMPDAIDGNHVSSSTEDLILRLDFEYPKDRNANVYIKNVSINEGYDEDFVTASNFNSITEYPYHYTTYDRDVTANVPSSGFNVGNKFRFETQQALASDEYIEKGITLSYRERATKKSFDTSPIDSNKLGMFFSPVKEINMDILKSLGQFEIDQYIGEPDDRYRNEYFELRKLRNYYFERYTINLYEYIQLVRYIDQSLFETLESLVPARAIVSSGLLIEPHILERSKYEHKKPQAVDVAGKFADGKITLREGKQLLFEDVNPLPFNLNPTKGWKLRGDRRNYSGLFKNHRPRFRGNYNQYNTRIGGLLPVFLPSLDLIDGRITDTQFVQKLMKQFEVLGGQEQVGVDPRNLTNGLAGIYARNGIANITRLDGNGTLIKERKQVWIVTEQFTVKEPQRNAIGLYVDVDVVKTRKIVVFNEIGDPAPSGVNILSAEAVNSNGGNVRGSSNLGKKYANDNDRGFRNETKQTSKTTLDGKSAVETFCTNPNILKVADSKRGAGEPILQVEG